ncbi:sugar ABC transporter ATP-binding protein [soil metagenome]
MPFQVVDLRKAYAGVEVLRGIDLAIEDGEIHALLGANGAGKSTLIKCVSGAEQPDSGQIVIGEERFAELSPKEAHRAGVSVIYQELSLASSLSVADNVFLGQELHIGPFVRHRAQERETAMWLEKLGVTLAPNADLSGVGHAELQTIEIIKALRTNPRLLILDEPTASLSEREAARLGQHLLALKKQRLPILYVTHRMSEVFDLADRFTVLRGGKVALTGRVQDHERGEIIEAIVGRSLQAAGAAVDTASSLAPPVLEVTDLLASGIGPIDVSVQPGEIFGVFGLVGSGRTELLEALFAARPWVGGRLRLGGVAHKLRGPPEAVAAGIALVPADRPRNSVFGALSAVDNWGLPNLAKLSRRGIRQPSAEAEGFDSMATDLDLRPRRPQLEARRFSGGNQQKLVLGRWLSRANCSALLLDEPTQGVDVGARRDLYDALRRFVDGGDRCAIVTSSEPEELIQLAHRVIVLSHGRMVGELRGSAITEARLLSLAHHDATTVTEMKETA